MLRKILFLTLFSFFSIFTSSSVLAISFGVNAQIIDTISPLADSINAEQPGERILSYDVDIKIDKDAGIIVEERIRVHAMGKSIDRGIFRSLPTKRNLNGKTFRIVYDLLSVTRDGADEHYLTSYEPDKTTYYLGSEDVHLEPGIYEYVIRYSAKNQIGFFDKFDELYWNVTGNDWAFPIEKLSATIHLPTGASVLQQSCYTGIRGSTDTNCNSNIIDGGKAVRWEAKNFVENEGLTVAVGFTKGVVTPPPPPTFLEKYLVTILLSIIFVFLVYYCFSIWRKYGVDPPKPVVVPQFDPPHNISPASMGYLLKEDYNEKLISASLVNLAVKGYLKIDEVEKMGFLGISKSKDYKLTVLNYDLAGLPGEEKELLKGLFTRHPEVDLDGDYSRSVETAANEFQSDLHSQYKKFLKEGDNVKLVVIPIVIAIISFIAGLVISYSITPFVDKLMIGIAEVVGFGILFGVFNFFKKIKSTKGFGCLAAFLVLMFGAPILSIFLLFRSDDTFDLINFQACYIFLAFCFVGLIILLRVIKRPSEEKLKIQSEIEGFKMYMGAAENNQLQFHNPPEMSPERFEKFLPYAMILGVEDIWGKKFQSLLDSSSIEYNSNWYHGAAFNSVMFGSSFNNSFTNSFSSSSTAPSSSGGGSFGSGSSGGGSSGGGGGGGGGGGW